MEDVSIERAHRIGKRESGKIRPIVVKFTRFPQRELVRKSAFKLKNTDLSISEQFPREIQDRRKQLLPVLKQAKANNRKTVLLKISFSLMGDSTDRTREQHHYQTERDPSRDEEVRRMKIPSKLLVGTLTVVLKTSGVN